MKKIVKISPAIKQFSITWMIESRCNYECMYCPEYYHDNISRYSSLAEMKEYWNQIIKKTHHLNLPYKISFTGGEVTINKNFIPFLEWIKSQKYQTQIGITSNGSASLSYYKKISKFLSFLSFSTHSEFMDEKLFFLKAKEMNSVMIRPEKSFHVNIMKEYWNTNRITMYEKYCINNNISYSINEVKYDLKIRDNIVKKGKQNLEECF